MRASSSNHQARTGKALSAHAATAASTSAAGSPTGATGLSTADGGKTGSSKAPLGPPANLSIFPLAGDFPDVETDAVFVVPFTLQNSGSRLLSVRLVNPQTSVFRLLGAPQSIAPGMRQMIEVEFSSKVAKEYHDSFSVRTEDGIITVPLHAWFPAPDIRFDRIVDLGRVSAQHPQEPRRLRLVNHGKRDGAFNFSVDPSAAGLSITPASGVLPAGHARDVQIHYFATEPGHFRGLVHVDVEGQPRQRVDVVAEVVEARMGLLDAATLEPLSHIALGQLFFGQTRSIRAVLRNYGQLQMSFAARMMDDGDMQPQSAEAENTAATTALALARRVECRPSEGRIGAGESCELLFTYAPQAAEGAKGWTHRDEQPKAFDLNATYAIEVVESEQRIEVQLSGRALESDFRVSQRAFIFTDTAVNDHRDIAFTFTNNSAELPMSFNFTQIAHFKVSPASGVVPPLGQQNLVMSFRPSQLGTFHSTITLGVNDGVRTLPLTVAGRASTITAKLPLIGGPSKVAEDFERPRKFDTGVRRAAHSASLPPIARAGPSVQPATGAQAAATNGDLLLLSEWHQRREHDFLYSNYLTNARKARELLHEVQANRVSVNPDDLGMVPADGLVPPEPTMPRHEDPLPFGLDQGGDDAKGGAAMVQRKAFKADENKLIKKKFRREPATLNEVRECKLVLSPTDIQGIIIPNKVLDFGSVSVYSTNVKSFVVYNTLKTHIWVSIPFNIREELAESPLMSQVIPPGQQAGFDVVFKATTPQHFQQAVYFSINETHKLKFAVFAEAKPIDVQLSTGELNFRFPDFGVDSSVTLPVVVTNPGNSVLEYHWSVPDGPFAISPAQGAVPPFSAATVDVSYTPTVAANESSAVATITAKGGVAPRAVKLSGSVTPASCSWIGVRDGRVDFKKVPVGAARVQTFALKNNHSSNSAVFHFDASQLGSGFTVSPVKGRIAGGGSEEITVTLRATSAAMLKSTLSCHVRGMKQLMRLQLTAEARVPDFAIVDPPPSSTSDTSDLAFGGVYVGSADTRRITIQNNDEVTATFMVDLSQHPDMTVVDQDHRTVEAFVGPDDDIVIPAGATGWVGLYRASSIPREAGAARGRTFRVSVAPRSTHTLYLRFAPTMVGPVQFVLPLSLYGTELTSAALRQLMVTGEAKKSRLVVSHTALDFGSCVVVRDGTIKAPCRRLVTVTNETEADLQWELVPKAAPRDAALGSSDAFRVEPLGGRLQPGQSSQVQVTFTPTEVRSYRAAYAVCLDGRKDQRYVDIEAKGVGSNPSLCFDRTELVMPTVPLDVHAKATFYVLNYGYESLDIKYRIAGDGRLPISLTFPEGQTITSSHAQLPVEVHFTSKRPITFTVNIDFYDDADGIFSLPVTCCADNSLISTFGYLMWRDKAAVMSADGDKRPVMLRETESWALDRDVPRVPQAASAATTAEAVDGSGIALTFASTDIINRRSLATRALARLKTWLNANVMHEAIDDVVASMQVSRGRQLVDLLETLSGKPVFATAGKEAAKKAAAPAPGSVNLVNPGVLIAPTTGGQAAAAAAAPPTATAPGSGARKDTVWADVEQLDLILLFLKQYGACVSDVRPEYLLRFEDFCRLQDALLAPPGSMNAPSVAATARVVPARLSEKRFQARAAHAWGTVLLQALRVFYVARVTWRAFKTGPQSAALQAAATTEKWSALQMEPSAVGSNVLSTPESLLLKWLSVHFAHTYGAAQAAQSPRDARPIGRRGAALSEVSAAASETPRICNFDEDLRDCRAWAACVVGYIPTLAARFDPDRENGFNLAPATALDFERNAGILLEALKEYGIDWRLAARDLLENSARDNLLLTAALFHALPQYVPKTSVKFKGKLLEKTTRTIELSNPSRVAVDYTVLLDGNEDFKAAETTVHLEPKSTVAFSLSVTPRFSRRIEGRVYFISSRVGAFNAATLAFGLETAVDPDSALKTIEGIEAPAYESITHDAIIENPFPVSGQFTVQLQQEYMRPGAEASVGAYGAPLPPPPPPAASTRSTFGKKDAGLPPAPLAPMYAEVESMHHFPDAFWSSVDQLTLAKGAKVKFPLQFLPCVRGRYKVRVVFRDEKVGEFAYVFIATCLPPRPYDSVQLQTEGTAPVQREVAVPIKHAQLEKALAVKDDRSKLLKGALGRPNKAKDGAAAEAHDGRDVIYKVEFVNERFVGPNPFFSGPRTLALRSGADAELDDAAHNRRRRAGAKGGAGPATTTVTLPGATHVNLPITFTPKGPGTYNALVVLSSPWDVRVLAIEAKSRSPGMKGDLEFTCPARQQITQEIPITNTSDREWVVAATLQGECFNGPREVRVPPGRTRPYTLSFCPQWMTEVQGQLVLRNNDTQERYTYALRGHAEEPLAENTVVIECRARELRKVVINVPNIGVDETVYQVETDLPFVSGEPRLVVPKLESGKYTLHVLPQLSGKTHGSVTFIAPNRQYVWFVVQVNVLRPPAENTVTITSEVRRGAEALILLSNPKDRIVDFVVRHRGEGLRGDEVFTLQPKQQNAPYKLYFAPTKAGEADGMISFNNNEAGEFWFNLHLIAKEAAPVPIALQCELGKTATTEVTLENPTDVECAMSIANSNETNFSLAPANVVLRPRGSARVTITYVPSAIQMPQTGRIIFAHPKAGMWEFDVTGVGAPPTTTEPVHLKAELNTTVSSTVSFRNPFPVPKRFIASLVTRDGGVVYDSQEQAPAPTFALLTKKLQQTLAPFQTMQVPLSYTPRTVMQHTASVFVQPVEDVPQQHELKWEFALVGVSEGTNAGAAQRVSCRARKEVRQLIALPLHGLPGAAAAETFHATVSVPQDAHYRRAAMSSVRLEQLTEAQAQLEDPAIRDVYPGVDKVYYRIAFAPLRPFNVAADLVVSKESGGHWRFPLALEAQAPEADDVITIEAGVNVLETVTFTLYNVLPQPSPFVAYFSADSPSEFSVAPTRGTFPVPSSAGAAAGAQAGQQMAVSFASSQYGKTLNGTLVVETEEMQWRFEVRGTLPRYEPPTGLAARLHGRATPAIGATPPKAAKPAGRGSSVARMR